MEELEIKRKIKERYSDISDDDVDEMYQELKDNNSIPKDDKELSELFEKLDLLAQTLTIDDSEDF